MALEKTKKLKAVITQNCDNLHAKAGTTRASTFSFIVQGTDPDILFELHGNVFVEYCEICFTTYKRDYCVDLYSTNCYLEKWYAIVPVLS